MDMAITQALQAVQAVIRHLPLQTVEQAVPPVIKIRAGGAVAAVAFPSLAQRRGMAVQGAVAAQLLDPLIRLPQAAEAAHWAQPFY